MNRLCQCVIPECFNRGSRARRKAGFALKASQRDSVGASKSSSPRKRGSSPLEFKKNPPTGGFFFVHTTGRRAGNRPPAASTDACRYYDPPLALARQSKADPPPARHASSPAAQERGSSSRRPVAPTGPHPRTPPCSTPQ